MRSTAEIVAGRLFFCSDRQPPQTGPGLSYFCVDEALEYQPFNQDFGPLNISSTYKYCKEVERLLAEAGDSSIYHYTSLDPHKRANAACLMGAFQVLVLGRSADQAWARLQALAPFEPFRDAGSADGSYKLSIHDCLRGLAFGVSANWFDYANFNVSDYDFYEQVENGDWNWIIPGKLLALACPSATTIDSDGFRLWTPEDYGPLFQSIGVTAIVRLNNKTYDSGRFMVQDLNHYDLFFPDGSSPSLELVQQFIELVERESGVAVHCKAGLGRTGTMIGCYAMKHYSIDAAAFIGWIRLMRPGSVIGPQQQFLLSMEHQCKVWGNQAAPLHHVHMTPEEKRASKYGDAGQAERLVSAKKAHQTPGKNGRHKSAANGSIFVRPKAANRFTTPSQRSSKKP